VIKLSPTDVPHRGLSGRLSLGILVATLVGLVTVAVIGREPAPVAFPSPSAVAPSAAILSPTATPRRSLAPTASPTPSCPTPRVAAHTGPLPRHSRDLTPTGLETVARWAHPDGQIRPDRDGVLWSYGSGTLSRFDPATGTSAQWTYADDDAFAANGIATARDGGVWLLGSRTVAWFDGERFRDAIAAPGQVMDLAEAADGSIWVAALDLGVFHWDGRGWTSICDSSAGSGADQIAIGPWGDVWVANVTQQGNRAGFSRYDGAGWTSVPNDTVRPFGPFGWVVDMATDRTGGLIVGFYSGLARYDGESWATLTPADVTLEGIVSMAVADDGTIWTASGLAMPPGATDRYSGVGVARVDPSGVTTFGSEDGLPAPMVSSWATIGAVAAIGQEVYATTREGLYRLGDGDWSRIGPPVAPAPTWANGLVAVSRSEAWLAAEDGPWRLHDGRLTTAEIADWPRPLRVSNVARGRDGVLAVATDRGVAVRRGGRWMVLEEGKATQVAFDEEGAVWTCIDPLDQAPIIATYRFTEDGWRRGPAWPGPSAVGGDSCSALAIDQTGGVWAGVGGGGTTFVHLEDGTWETVHPLAKLEAVGVLSIATASNGEVWAALQIDSSLEPTATVARYDGTVWTLFGPADGIPGAWVNRVAVAPDGSVWATTDAGVAQFDGERWSPRFTGQWFDGLSIARDGTVWLTGASGVSRVTPD